MTIEERAKFYEPDAFDANEIFPAREGHIVNRIRNAYIAGATEQKAIDIDKACKWLIDHVQPDGDGDEMLDDFRKAMTKEDQLCR